MERSGTVFTSTNRVALAGWSFISLFLLFCAAFTYVLIRDGSSGYRISPSSADVYPPWVLPAVAALFWLVGLAVAERLFRTPCVTITVDDAGTTAVRKRYIFSTKVSILPPEAILSIELVEEKDSEGDPYFSVEVSTAEGEILTVAEGSDRPECETLLRRFSHAVGKTA